MARVDEHLLWRDPCVSVFGDEDKVLAVYVNDKGKTRVINYDDNFYSIYEDIRAYNELLLDSLEVDGVLRDCDKEDYQKMVDDFIYDQLVKEGVEIDYDYLKELGVNYYGKK